MKKDSIFTLILVIVAICVGGFFYKRYHVPPAIDIPTITLTDLNGNKVSLSAYNGHPLFISFFATWCGPCLNEMPELAELKTSLADKQLQVVCITDESIEKIRRMQYYTSTGTQLIILRSEQPLHDIGIYTFPTNYIYDARGKKVYEKTNADNWMDPKLISKIRELLD